MSKLIFFEMRAEQLATMYEPTFTKKDAQRTGIELIQTVLDDGNVDKVQLVANLVRLQEVINTAVIKLREHLPEEKIEAFGVSFTPTNGGNTLNYADDRIYNVLKSDLDERVELLKLAQKQEVLDLYGQEVPKVSTTPRKSSITIKF